jgi:hypothetical protein
MQPEQTKARMLKLQIADELKEDHAKLSEAVRRGLPTSYVTDQLLVLRYGPGTLEQKRLLDRNRVLLAEVLASITDPDVSLLGVHTEAVS